MPDLPAAGERWFHRESLTPVTMVKTDRDYEGGEWVCISDPVAPEHWEVSHADFLRDYRRDQPITLDLLEGMGWGVNRNSGIGTLEVKDLRVARETWGLWFDGDGLTLVRWGDDNSQDSLRLATPHTLRDLLLVLKVFGVDAKGTEVGR